MLMPLIYNDPEHWPQRAVEARALAAKMIDPQGKASMLEIAGGYDRVARRAVERLSQVQDLNRTAPKTVARGAAFIGGGYLGNNSDRRRRGAGPGPR